MAKIISRWQLNARLVTDLHTCSIVCIVTVTMCEIAVLQALLPVWFQSDSALRDFSLELRVDLFKQLRNVMICGAWNKIWRNPILFSKEQSVIRTKQCNVFYSYLTEIEFGKYNLELVHSLDSNIDPKLGGWYSQKSAIDDREHAIAIGSLYSRCSNYLNQCIA